MWIPKVSTSTLFHGRSDSRFAVGIVAYGGHVVPGLEEEHRAYGLLRANVYARERHYMSVDGLNADGTETDGDDPRSVHFGLYENAATSVRAVGSMRLIIKEEGDARPLPIEQHYGSLFETQPAPAGSVEVSRLISRHESPDVQRNLKWPLFAASVSYIVDNGLGAVFGAVEEELEDRLRKDGVPVTALAEPHFVPEFNSAKLPIRVDIAGLGAKLQGDTPTLFEASRRVEREFVYLRSVNAKRE